MTSEEIRTGRDHTLGDWLREIAAMQAEIIAGQAELIHVLRLMREELER